VRRIEKAASITMVESDFGSTNLVLDEVFHTEFLRCFVGFVRD